MVENISRRQFLKLIGAAATTLALVGTEGLYPSEVTAQTVERHPAYIDPPVQYPIELASSKGARAFTGENKILISGSNSEAIYTTNLNPKTKQFEGTEKVADTTISDLPTLPLSDTLIASVDSGLLRFHKKNDQWGMDTEIPLDGQFKKLEKMGKYLIVYTDTKLVAFNSETYTTQELMGNVATVTALESSQENNTLYVVNGDQISAWQTDPEDNIKTLPNYKPDIPSTASWQIKGNDSSELAIYSTSYIGVDYSTTIHRIVWNAETNRWDKKSSLSFQGNFQTDGTEDFIDVTELPENKVGITTVRSRRFSMGMSYEYLLRTYEETGNLISTHKITDTLASNGSIAPNPSETLTIPGQLPIVVSNLNSDQFHRQNHAIVPVWKNEEHNILLPLLTEKKDTQKEIEEKEYAL